MGKARHKSLRKRKSNGEPLKLIALILGAVAFGAFIDTVIRSGILAGILGFGRSQRSLAGKSFPLEMPSDLRREMETKPGYD